MCTQADSAHALRRSLVSVPDLPAVAKATPTTPFRGATPEQVNAVAKLSVLATFIREHCRAILMDGEGPWQDLAEELEAGATLCLNQFVLAEEFRLAGQ